MFKMIMASFITMATIEFHGGYPAEYCSTLGGCYWLTMAIVLAVALIWRNAGFQKDQQWD